MFAQFSITFYTRASSYRDPFRTGGLPARKTTTNHSGTFLINRSDVGGLRLQSDHSVFDLFCNTIRQRVALPGDESDAPIASF